MLFVLALCLLEANGLPSALFIVLYLLAGVCQVAVLLYLCQIIVYSMWSSGTDPDNAAIPYLTAVSRCKDHHRYHRQHHHHHPHHRHHASSLATSWAQLSSSSPSSPSQQPAILS